MLTMYFEMNVERSYFLFLFVLVGNTHELGALESILTVPRGLFGAEIGLVSLVFIEYALSFKLSPQP